MDGLGPVSQVRSLTQLLKTGIFYEDPDEAVCEGAKCRFADIIILKKWANKIWKSENLTPIGLRVLEALWVGSLVVNRENPEKQENWEAKMARCFNDSKELWLTLPVNVGHINTLAQLLCQLTHLCADSFIFGTEKG